MDETSSADRHGRTVEDNRLGIRRGADSRHSQGIISANQRREIYEIVDACETSSFLPLIYVIPYELVAHIIEKVPVAKRAHPLSEEYIIDRLSRELFDVLEFD